MYLTYKKGALDLPSTYNKEALRAVARDRGYTERELADELARATNNIVKVETRKIQGTSWWTHGEMIFLARLLEMSPREYAECFCKGLFIEDAAGNFHGEPLIDERTYLNLPKHVKQKMEMEAMLKDLEDYENYRIDTLPSFSKYNNASYQKVYRKK